jgi:hypothetical protein
MIETRFIEPSLFFGIYLGYIVRRLAPFGEAFRPAQSVMPRRSGQPAAGMKAFLLSCVSYSESCQIDYAGDATPALLDGSQLHPVDDCWTH